MTNNFNIITQIIKYNQMEISKTKLYRDNYEPYDIDNDQIGIMLNPIYSLISFIKNLNKTGINITGIEYNITTMPSGRAPFIKNVNYASNKKEELSIGIINLSTLEKDSRTIEDMLKETIFEYLPYFKELDKIDKEEINEELVGELINELLIKNSINIKSLTKKKYKTKWRKENKGIIRFLLDKTIICENPNHNKMLSDLELIKPYTLTELICDKCNQQMIIHPTEINDLTINNVQLKTSESLKYGIVHAIDLGVKITKLTNLMFSKRIQEKTNINQIVILPKTIYYSTNEGNYKLIFKSLTKRQFQRTIGRKKYNRIEITNYKEVN